MTGLDLSRDMLKIAGRRDNQPSSDCFIEGNEFVQGRNTILSRVDWTSSTGADEVG